MAKSGPRPGRSFPLDSLRNLGIAAHIDAGKTTLTERILFYTGAVRLPGEVDDGTSTTDWMPLERERGITITAAVISCAWPPPPPSGAPAAPASPVHHINLIDTPGHVDFTAEVERSLRVLDGMIAVFCGVAGVQPQSETVWRQADKYHVPRLAFINKLDRIGADFWQVLAEMRHKLGANAAPVVIPFGTEGHVEGVVDVVRQQAMVYAPDDPLGRAFTVTDIPAALRETAQAARRELILRLADLDEPAGNMFLEDKEFTVADLKAAIRRQTTAGRFVPVLGGSAFKNRGVQPLLDAVVDYLPSPADVPPAEGVEVKTGKTAAIPPNDDGHLCALVFKLWTAKDIGKLVFLRVYAGTLTKGDAVYHPRTRRRERVVRLMRVQAGAVINIESCHAGDLVAVAGLKNAVTGDTLCVEHAALLLEPATFPEPVVSVAIEPKTRADLERLSLALARLAEDDPTFRVSTDRETGQTLIAGMGELHLEVIRERLRSDFNVASNAGKPRIAYRETITQEAVGEGKHIKQLTAGNQYGHVIVRVAPAARGAGVLVENEVRDERIPAAFLPACEAGIREALQDGVVGGYPVADLRATIQDGSSHSTDSVEIAYKLAAIQAVRAALTEAGATLLEPIMKVECVAPPEFQGDLIGDLNSRRGHIVDVRPKGGLVHLHARVPLAEMFGYANAIRSLSTGRATFSMEPSHFEPVPPKEQAAVLGFG